MATTRSNAPPQLDDAFYAMIASHFPALEPGPSLAPAVTRNIQPTLASSTDRVISAATTSSSQGKSLNASTKPDKAVAALSTSTSTSSMIPAPSGNLQSHHGHRSTTSVYHPQPTRSGRIPVPPPEEELQAMLAMDNYFEFPSESESDDDDFVMPASEPNDDDDEQDDETPRNESIPGVPAAEHLGEYEGNWATDVDSAEYDWLMENLKAMEKTASAQSPADYTVSLMGSASPANNNYRTNSPEAGPSSQTLSRRSDEENNSSQQSASKGRSIKSTSRPTALARVRTRDNRDSSFSDTPPLGHLQTLPQPEQIPLDTPGRHDSSALAPDIATRSSTTRRNKNAKGRKDADFTDLPTDADSTGVNEELATVPKSALKSLDKLEDKRKRNAEQSRTFRERQRALKEATADRIQQLEEENCHLRQEISVLKLRLHTLDGTSRPTTRARAAPDPVHVHGKQLSKHPTTGVKRRKISAIAESPRDTPARLPTSQVPQGSMSFEDLGKFVAGFVQAKSQSLPENASSSACQDTATSRRVPSSESSESQNPLLLLTQLLASQPSQ